MSDRATRALERAGEREPLHVLLRKDELRVAYPSSGDVKCGGTCVRACCKSSPHRYGYLHPCTDCGEQVYGTNPTGRVPADPLDVLRVLAFCGDEEAALVLKGQYLPVVMLGEGLTSTGISVLRRRCAKLPDRRESSPPERRPFPHTFDCACVDCVTDTPADRWLLTAAAVAAGREINKTRLQKRRATFAAFGSAGLPDDLITPALDAASRWVDQPTLEREKGSWPAFSHALPDWVPTCLLGAYALPSDALFAAAKILTPERVREIVCAEIRRRVRG